MPDTKISALTAAAALDGAEQFPVVQGAANRAATGAQIRTFVGYIKHNMTADAAPAATDDSSSGYAAGSMWMWDETGDMWRCRSAAVGAAKWTRIDVADHPGYVAGNWNTPYSQFAAGTGAVLGNTSIRLTPIVIKQRITISEMGVRVTTAAAGGLFGLAIYNAHAITKRPTGLPIVSGIGLSTASTGIVSLAGLTTTLEPGLYWSAIVTDSATVVFSAVSAGANIVGTIIGDAAATVIPASAGAGVSALSAAGTYSGGFTDMSAATFSLVNSNGNAALGIKVASVP